jgi:hypothetical protein
LQRIEFAVREKYKYKEFRIVRYEPIRIFIIREPEGWAFATPTLNVDIETFYSIKNFNLTYYFVEKAYFI